jgi:hypothetical protein
MATAVMALPVAMTVDAAPAGIEAEVPPETAMATTAAGTLGPLIPFLTADRMTL